MEEGKTDLKKVLGSSYLVKFSEDVDNLLAVYSQYVTVEIDTLSANNEVDIDKIKVFSQTMRTYTLRAYISYLTLFNIINKESPADEDKLNKKEIERIVKDIKEHIILNSSDIEAFLIAINKYLYSDIIKNLMDTAQQTISNIYNLKDEKQ